MNLTEFIKAASLSVHNGMNWPGNPEMNKNAVYAAIQNGTLRGVEYDGLNYTITVTKKLQCDDGGVLKALANLGRVMVTTKNTDCFVIRYNQINHHKLPPDFINF